jgi:c-di-GMP-binding flagellar brake protein YcgR
MGLLEELSSTYIDAVLDTVVSHCVPLVVTVREDERWTAHRSRFLAVRDGSVVIEAPIAGEQSAPHEFVPGERLWLTFRLRRYKYVCDAIVAGFERVRQKEDEPAGALVISRPAGMQRVQRRSSYRAVVPGEDEIWAWFGVGDFSAEERPPSSEWPMWQGALTNLGVGGFEMVSEDAAACGVDVGDRVGVCLVFEAEGKTVTCEAQIRRIRCQGRQAVLGMQFVDLAETRRGRKALEFLCAKVEQYKQAEQEAKAAASGGGSK